MTTTSDPTHARVDLYCQELKLHGVRTTFAQVAREAVDQNQSYPAFLAACLAQESEARRQHRLATRLSAARFPVVKTLDQFDFRLLPRAPKAKILTLADGAFIRAHENVICLGSPGTGKTHVATGVGVAAIAAGYRVRFISAMLLAQELLAAQQAYRLPRYLKSWQAFDLVIVDELGYLGLGPGGPLLFQFCAERYERGSLLITTNLDFARWAEVFGDPILTGALLDRLTHHAHLLLFDGESHRFRESRQQRKEVPPPLPPPPPRPDDTP